MTDDLSRRGFIERAGMLGIAGTAAPFVMNLAAIGEAAAATAPDYKALVCVYLYGGNDYANTLIPYDQQRYDQYAAMRPALALPRASLDTGALTPAVPLAGGGQYALPPALAPLLPIWNAGKLAPILNVGTLLQPTSKAQYSARSVPLPPKLFSHNDQQSYWLAGAPEGAATGWGGRIGDLFMAGNGNATLTCINPAGSTVFLSGRSAVQYSITTAGPVALNNGSNTYFGSDAIGTTLKTLMTAPRTHLIENEVTRVGKRSLDSYGMVLSALGKAPPLQTQFPYGGLADQLRVVAQMIATSSEVGAKRQVFAVGLGGFDHHSGLSGGHADLLGRVGAAMRAFYDATVELKVADRVTAFTASEFGRTMASNGTGSDHGWGSIHFAMGGAVKGKRFYGSAPVIASDGPDDVGQGRLLPAIAVDQYAATLATWFGVPDSSMSLVLPNIGAFSNRNLGFV